MTTKTTIVAGMVHNATFALWLKICHWPHGCDTKKTEDKVEARSRNFGGPADIGFNIPFDMSILACVFPFSWKNFRKESIDHLNIINHCSSGIEAALSNAEQALNKWLESIWFPYVEEVSRDSTKGGSSTSTGRFLKNHLHLRGKMINFIGKLLLQGRMTWSSRTC